MKILGLFNLVAITLLFTIGVNAQTNAFDMSKKMSRGINIGNTLDAENYEGGWAPVASEKDFEAIKEAGFTCVRIPITWGAQLSKDDDAPRVGLEKPYKINPEFLARVDQLVNWALDRDLIAVINVHHDKWLKCRTTFDEKSPRFYSIWEQLAKHYKDYSENLLFEILNEPHHTTNGEEDGLTQEQVNLVNKMVLSIIRKKNPTRIAIYSGCTWGSLWDLKKTQNPDSTDVYVMGTYHSYSPWPYAGDGNGVWGSDEDKSNMEDEFKNLVEYSKEKNVPVFIGEFGAQHQCDYNSRMLHYACYVENIQKYQVASTAWDDNGFLFKIYDKTSGVWDDTKDILVNYSPVSPNGIALKIADADSIKINWNNRAGNIKEISIERRIGRIGKFEEIAKVDKVNNYADAAPKEKQLYYYYRVVNRLEDNSVLYSYPQRVYLP